MLALAVHNGAHTDGGWYVPVSVSALWLEVRLPTVAHTLPDGGLGGLGGGGGFGGGVVLYSVLLLQAVHSGMLLYSCAVPFMLMIAPCHGTCARQVEAYQPMYELSLHTVQPYRHVLPQLEGQFALVLYLPVTV